MYCSYFRIKRQDQKCNLKCDQNKNYLSRQYDSFNGQFCQYQKCQRCIMQFNYGYTTRQSILSIKIRIKKTQLKVLNEQNMIFLFIYLTCFLISLVQDQLIRLIIKHNYSLYCYHQKYQKKLQLFYFLRNYVYSTIQYKQVIYQQNIFKQYINKNIFKSDQMKSSFRTIPHLNQLYLQKKSYQIHRKKIQSIKRSNSFTKKSLDGSRILQNQQSSFIHQYTQQPQANNAFIQNQKSDNDLMQYVHMQTIQQVKPNMAYWMKKMNPLQKRIKQQQIKQNKRLRQRIKNSTSFITRKNQLSDHKYLFQGMKKRLTKFSSHQITHKTSLKCQIVLQKIDKLEKSRLKTQQSRIKLFVDQKEKLKSSFSINKTTFQLQNKQKQPNLRTISSLELRTLIDQKKSELISDNKGIFITGEDKQKLHSQSQNVNKNNDSARINKIRSNIILKKSPVKIGSLPNNNNDSISIFSKTQLQKPAKKPVLVKPQRLRILRTQPAQKNSVLNRNSANISKLSKFSHSTSTPKKSFDQYKMIKSTTPLSQSSQQSFTRIPTVRYEYLYPKHKINSFNVGGQVNRNNFTQKRVFSRIKTQGTQIGKLFRKNINPLRTPVSNKSNNNLINQDKIENKIGNGLNNRYDYQRKRIERFLKDKNSVIVSTVTSKKQQGILPRISFSQNKQAQNVNKTKNIIPQIEQQLDNLKNFSQINQQKIRKSKPNIEESIRLKDQQKPSLQKQKQTKVQQSESYFATEIQ